MTATADKRRQKRGESPLSHHGAPSPSREEWIPHAGHQPTWVMPAGRVKLTHSALDSQRGRTLGRACRRQRRGQAGARVSTQSLVKSARRFATVHVEAEGLPCVGNELRATLVFAGLPPMPGTPRPLIGMSVRSV